MREAASHQLACDETIIKSAVEELNGWLGGAESTSSRWRRELIPQVIKRYPGILEGCFVRYDDVAPCLVCGCLVAVVTLPCELSDTTTWKSQSKPGATLLPRRVMTTATCLWLASTT